MFSKNREKISEKNASSVTVVHFLHDGDDTIMTGLLRPDYLPRKEETVVLDGEKYIVNDVVYHFRSGRGNYVNIYLMPVGQKD